MATNPPYKYPSISPPQPSPQSTPTAQIRLLTLHPGAFNDEISVTLHKATLSTNSPNTYEALSYVWGSEKDPIPITVNQKWTVKITQNLFTALKHLRLADKPRLMWIDAVCINQDDLQERAQQVTLMRKIYEQAGQIVVWLGPEEDDSALALDWLQMISDDVEVDWLNNTMSSPWGADDCFWFVKGEREREGLALLALLRRVWFERLWIRQEVFMARRAVVRCGGGEISWADFKNAVFCMKERGVYFGQTEDELEVSRMFTQRLLLVCGLGQERIRLHLITLLEETCASQCKDPSDKVYGIMGMLSGSRFAESIVPDYTVSAAEVYTIVSVEHMRQFRTLRLLARAGVVERGSALQDRLPSWVPDWTVERPGVYMVQTYKAGGGLACQASLVGKDVLKVSGVVISSVAEIFPFWTGDQDSAISKFEVVRRMMPCSPRSLGFYKDHDGLLAAYSRAIYRSIYSEYVFPADIGREDLSVQDTLDILADILQGKIEKRDQITKAERTFLHSGLEPGITCLGEEGPVGFVPRSTKVGDLLCVFPGCADVMVLRPEANKAGYYVVVGNAFLDGYMSGEALLGPLPEGVTRAHSVDPEAGAVYPCYLDTSTMELMASDPRISRFGIKADITEDWSLDDEVELLWKITPQMLLDRGVKLKDFYLV